MSINHKAYIFDYDRFQIELMELLEKSLNSDDFTNLIIFIEQNLSYLKDPYEGQPLDAFWEAKIAIKDAHNYGELAITKFYDPQNCIGLSYKWAEIDDLLCFEFGERSLITLGKLLGPKNKVRIFPLLPLLSPLPLLPLLPPLSYLFLILALVLVFVRPERQYEELCCWKDLRQLE
jgi:hypothetical protein